jgi:hypothetical protein
MDVISEIIHTFSEKERNEFRHFLLRQKYSESRKDLKLYEDLVSGSEEKFVRKNKQTPDSYHGLRKRLMRNLSDFLIVKEKTEDITEAGTIAGWISLSKYFFRHGLFQPAWKYLLKAERTGWETDQFELLASVYLLMVEQAHTNEDLDLNEIIKKQKEAHAFADENERMMISTALIRQRLKECKINLSLEGFPEYVEKVFDEYNLNVAILNRPAHLIQLLEIVRNTYLALRQLKNFEPFILEQYSKFNSVASMKKHNHEHRLRFLYMIAHVLYRNRKFRQSLRFLNEMHLRMEDYNRIFFKKFYPRYISLKCSLKSLSGENEEAISGHEKILLEKNLKLNVRDKLNMQLNLIFFYFNAGNFRKANSVFIRFEHSDKWQEKQMGQEWVLRKKLIHLIVQYELGNEDISLQMITQIEKDYSHLLGMSQYKKASNYLGIIRQYINDPFSLTFNDYRSFAARELFTVHPSEEESKAIAFYCWLKSKLLHKNYYKTLLEEVKLTGEVV